MHARFMGWFGGWMLGLFVCLMAGTSGGWAFADTEEGTGEAPAVENAASEAPLFLAKDGNALALIVLPDEATPVECNAGKELKSYLDQMTGGEFSVLRLAQVPAECAQPCIYVGDSPKVRELLEKADSPAVDLDKLAYDGIVLKTVGKDLVLVGHRQRGTLYAVYTLLEDTLGVRWWTAEEQTVPKRATIELPKLNTVYAPKLISRETLYRIAFDGIFKAHLKQNCSTRTRMNGAPVIPEEFGGFDRYVFYKGRGSTFHSFYEVLPPSKYFAEHPEWYSLRDGKRTAEHGQLCLTNEEMIAQYVENTRQLLRETPDARFISVTQNDWYGNCQCEKCRAIDEANGSPSGTMITFCNKVAEALEDEFPNVTFETFAYQYTRKAPTQVKPRRNVTVKLCSIECAFLFPLEDDPANADFVRDVHEWSHVTDRLFIWNYVTTFPSYMIPHPNMRGLAPDIRFFVKNHAVGLFEQGDAFCVAGDFVRLRNWVLSHLMWNPDLDEKKLFVDFLHGYYGEEVGEIFRQYLTLIHDRAQSVKGFKLRCFSTETPFWMDLDTFNAAMELMNQATETADRLETADPVRYAGLRDKVLRERIPMDHVALLFYSHFQKEAQKAGKPFLGPKDPGAAARELTERWKKFNVETWREFTTHQQFDAYCQKLIQDCDALK